MKEVIPLCSLFCRSRICLNIKLLHQTHLVQLQKIYLKMLLWISHKRLQNFRFRFENCCRELIDILCSMLFVVLFFVALTFLFSEYQSCYARRSVLTEVWTTARRRLQRTLAACVGSQNGCADPPTTWNLRGPISIRRKSSTKSDLHDWVGWVCIWSATLSGYSPGFVSKMCDSPIRA